MTPQKPNFNRIHHRRRIPANNFSASNSPTAKLHSCTLQLVIKYVRSQFHYAKRTLIYSKWVRFHLNTTIPLYSFLRLFYASFTPFSNNFYHRCDATLHFKYSGDHYNTTTFGKLLRVKISELYFHRYKNFMRDFSPYHLKRCSENWFFITTGLTEP